MLARVPVRIDKPTKTVNRIRRFFQWILIEGLLDAPKIEIEFLKPKLNLAIHSGALADFELSFVPIALVYQGFVDLTLLIMIDASHLGFG